MAVPAGTTSPSAGGMTAATRCPSQALGLQVVATRAGRSPSTTRSAARPRAWPSGSPRRPAASTAGGTRADVRGDAAASGGRGPSCHGSRTVRPPLAREAWSTGEEVAGAPWQTRRPPRESQVRTRRRTGDLLGAPSRGPADLREPRTTSGCLRERARSYAKPVSARRRGPSAARPKHSGSGAEDLLPQLVWSDVPVERHPAALASAGPRGLEARPRCAAGRDWWCRSPPGGRRAPVGPPHGPTGTCTVLTKSEARSWLDARGPAGWGPVALAEPPGGSGRVRAAGRRGFHRPPVRPVRGRGRARRLHGRRETLSVVSRPLPQTTRSRWLGSLHAREWGWHRPCDQRAPRRRHPPGPGRRQRRAGGPRPPPHKAVHPTQPARRRVPRPEPRGPELARPPPAGRGQARSRTALPRFREPTPTAALVRAELWRDATTQLWRDATTKGVRT